ncbi:hypothetical protein O181_021139 [Austropuccinia psidii MF-1]|uniref:Retrovirus-related Pol polyprotein from transposon TNT 1-94-like beta-barrel domain-containing protein n=1 Tax=Austropuccinia psidii MF-1 TaxID=1389203 RepID=A0A9Q3CA87_9BASI|nr:hypothetical protein [Austropuccinia psidii MF-1]
METVNIIVPSKFFSFTLLRKLSGDPKIHQYVEALSLNEELIKLPDLILLKLQDYHQNSTIRQDSYSSSATALLSESSHRYKILYYCTNAQSNSSISAHLSTAQALVTGNNLSTSRSNLITDCGVTHHMFKSKEMFSSLNTTPPVSVCTDDLSSSLLTKGIGSVSIMCGNKHSCWTTVSMSLDSTSISSACWVLDLKRF